MWFGGAMEEATGMIIASQELYVPRRNACRQEWPAGVKTLLDLAKLASKSESFSEEAQIWSPTLWPKQAAQVFYCSFLLSQ